MIYKAKNSDLEDIINLTKQTIVSSFSYEALKHLLEQEEIYKVFVYKEDTFKGFIITWQDGLYAQIVDMAVIKEEQNKGIGKKLLNHALKELVNTGVNEVTLEVRKSNIRAISFYENRGFKYLKTITNYYVNEDAYVYRWEK